MKPRLVLTGQVILMDKATHWHDGIWTLQTGPESWSTFLFINNTAYEYDIVAGAQHSS
jgi:hypothetical protein